MQGTISKLQTIGMLITLLSVIGGGFYTWGTFNQRLDVIEKKKFVVNQTVDLSEINKEIKELHNKINERSNLLSTEQDEDYDELDEIISNNTNDINIKIENIIKDIEGIKADIKINSKAIEYLDLKIEEFKISTSNPLL
tara:strand:+ start:175 stop:591 length:417 start_codon:yes stop_codon:yes gene_type:complete